ITFGWDNGTYTAPTLLDLLPYDPATLSKEGGRLSVIGSAGSSFDESAMWTALLKSGSQQIDKSHLGTALAGYATENFVNTNLNALKGAGLPTTEGYRNVTEIANTLLTFLTGSDTDSTINKWKELEAFLAGFSETDTLATALSVKADKTRSIIAGTGLSGGGDLSADRTLSLSPSGIKAGTYTKLTVDAYGRATSASGLIASDIPTLEISKINGLQDRLNTFVTLAGAQEITGEKNFTGGLKVNGGLLDYDPTHKVWKLDGNLLITGSTTWNAVGDYTAPTLLDLLPYDPATLSKEGGRLSVIGGGGSIGGGNIMLNGTLYEAANGVITLPDLYQKTPNGTASQFLKADGSVDSNLYALAYGGDQNSIQYSSKSNYLRVIDRRNDTILPTSYDNYNISGLFHMSGMPSSNWWSGIHVKGWGEGYATWELVGPSSTDNTNNRLYYRDGKGSSWATDWKGIAFLEDCNKVATPYFEGQNIYSDYGWWVVALCKLSPADSEYNYASGTMFYRRGNGIYPNGSVQFNVIKRYNQTNVNFGVLYNGYGINEGEDAPKPCTFIYNGVKYAGLKWASAASLDSIKTLIYDISTTGLPFYVKYFNSQSGEVFNTEIKNSIVELGSDISGTGLGTIGTIRILNRKAIDIKGEDWGYIQQASADRMFHVAVAKSTQSGLGGGLGNYEIRCNGTSEEGIFVRYSGSSYGKLGVVNRNGQESSISYYNNNTAVGADKPLWTVGAGIRNAYSFDWWFGTNGYRMTLDSDGKLFINRTNNNEGGPSVSLAIGDSDTGLHWQADGIIEFRSNAKQVGYWGYTNGRLFNCYFREPSGVTYEKASLMINGNGSTISPSIGFHQPGVVGCHLELDNGGNFRFKDSSGYRNVYAGNLIADAGFLYSRYNGIEIKIGSENDSYVHFITKPARSLYFANSLFVNGSVLPYSSSTYSLGDAGHLWNYVYGNHFMGNSASATFILPNYVGGQQANPQTYFNNSMGVKVAMTGVNPDSYWGDTLWINGYGGTDVPDMCALHFSRGGAPLIYISSQKYHATSYGTMYHIWTGYNSNHSSAAWTCSTLNANGRISTTSDIYSAGWVRAGGSNGFYCESYGGGIHMTDSTWVRVYNGKQFYVSSTSSDAIHTAGGINASGRIYAGGHLSTNGGLAVSGIYGDSGASGFNVYAVFQGRSDHGGIEVRASDNTFGIGVHSNDHIYWWWGTSTSTNSSSGKSYIMDYGGGNWSFTGNHYVSGYSTWGSDSRYKTYLGEVTLQLDQIADSPTIYYRWNSKKRDRDGLLHVGGYAQYTEQILPELTHETSNFKTMDYAVCAYVYAVHAARFLRDHLLSDYKWKSDTELRMYALEKENIKLRNRIEQLERRAA
ncbi:tail fiber domain-containing protein, partial [Bacteroides fragilis]